MNSWSSIRGMRSLALAWMCEELGDRERAQALNEDNLRRARATGNGRMEARSLSSLAAFPLGEGRFQDAFSILNEAYRIDRDSGYVADMAMDLCHFAEVLAAEGRAEAAARGGARSVVRRTARAHWRTA
jgi:tetratricopeptide (TPR) repeat protein